MMLTKSSYLILGLLSKEARSGYEIKRRIGRISSFYSSESNAQIYPVLKKLEQQGLVSSNLDESSGGRNKRIFTITKKGHVELMKWLESDCEIAVYREEFLLQLSLGQHLTKPALTKKLNFYRDSIIEKLEKLNQIVEHIKSIHKNKADQQYLLMVYDHIKMLLDAKLAWCNKTLKELR